MQKCSSNEHINLPTDVWSQHILSRVTLPTAAYFSQTCRKAHHYFSHYQQRVFLRLHSYAQDQLKTAKRAGINIQFAPLFALLSQPYEPELFNELMLDQKSTHWAIAAICGDIEWLHQHYPNTWQQLTTHNERHISYFLAYAGHTDTISQHVIDFLKQNKNQTHALSAYYIAGRMGHFLLTDYLQEQCHFRADQLLLNNENIELFYALHGQLNRLQTIHAQSPTRLLRADPTQCGYHLHYAIMGAQTKTAEYLAELTPGFLSAEIGDACQTAMDIAAKFGAVKMVKMCLQQWQFQPLEEDANGHTPLHHCGQSGSWGTFELLYPYYSSQSDIHKILQTVLAKAITHNHIDFAEQFIQRFGKDMINLQDEDGFTIAHYLMCSGNMITVRHMLQKYDIDLNAQNDQGQTGLVVAALNARDFNQPYQWRFIADVVNEFNHQFGEKLLDTKDKQGNTLRSLMDDANHDVAHYFDTMNIICNK